MRTTLRVVAGLSLVCGTLACREARAPSRDDAQPIATPRMPDGVHWMRNAAEHRALYHQAYRVAGERVARLARERDPGSWVVVLDADETVLDNSVYQKELAARGERFSSDTWNDWCRRRAAEPLPGVAAFLDSVEKLGGRIAIVTNRSVEVCPDTEANLQDKELPFDVVLCRPLDSDGSKAPRWEQLEKGTATPDLPPLEIVMWIGDNVGDFPGVSQESRKLGDEAFADFGGRFIVVPNPVYGSWERNPRD
jgi:5'-nucleotidase (lipoprotein e(P4) family)